MTSDQEFAEYLRSLPREKSAEQVEQEIAERDAELGPYVPHGGEVHHIPGESRH